MKFKDNVPKIYSTAVPALITLDTKGNLIIEGAGRFLNYDSEKISVNSRNKTIYIYGENLKITDYNKETISIKGQIKKIEIFEVN